MGIEISLFSKKSFIEASKKFVCVRLGSYESKEHQDMVRKLLNGTFQNTAFVVFAPDGKTTLTKYGRSPRHAFGRDVEAGMEKIANKYPAKGSAEDSVVTDFHSFKQSLNVAAADQRLLVFSMNAPSNPRDIDSNMKKVFNDADVQGRYFFDKQNGGNQEWAKNLKGVTQKYGIFIIRSGKFGTDGTVMKELPMNASIADIKAALKKANAEYAKTEKRKVYNEHISEGKKEGVNYKNTMPQGEDRDGDGKIDVRPERGGRGRPPF
ncbi:MAG: hypothetical protein ACI9E1_000676 [Cryomorphaceae bacterium]|jgi:hypothetical protein